MTRQRGTEGNVCAIFIKYIRSGHRYFLEGMWQERKGQEKGVVGKARARSAHLWHVQTTGCNIPTGIGSGQSGDKKWRE